ncbi:hypothetical protein EXN66_Car013975 [Channa argus]|uniref:Uncharacterized protein n=1 Tax=Channa argus TaxID=215402 RepID=A0A6G1Q7B1_CHAAH|nr:hypothetical protein EXN66_Car013975 [Channa argus]
MFPCFHVSSEHHLLTDIIIWFVSDKYQFELQQFGSGGNKTQPLGSVFSN